MRKTSFEGLYICEGGTNNYCMDYLPDKGKVPIYCIRQYYIKMFVFNLITILNTGYRYMTGFNRNIPKVSV